LTPGHVNANEPPGESGGAGGEETTRTRQAI
jgi:hypothetical protein